MPDIKKTVKDVWKKVSSKGFLPIAGMATPASAAAVKGAMGAGKAREVLCKQFPFLPGCRVQKVKEQAQPLQSSPSRIKNQGELFPPSMRKR